MRADDPWLADANGKPAFAAPSGSIQAVRSAPRDAARGPGGLWVMEVDPGLKRCLAARPIAKNRKPIYGAFGRLRAAIRFV